MTAAPRGPHSCTGCCTASGGSTALPLRLMAAFTDRRASFVLLGDSITELGFDPDGGWATRLAAHYVRRADVLNRGYSGYSTRWGLAAMPHVLAGTTATPPPTLVTIFFGANDASDATLNARQHVPLAEYEANLIEIVRLIREAWPDAKLVIVAPPPVGHGKFPGDPLLVVMHGSDHSDRLLVAVQPSGWRSRRGATRRRPRGSSSVSTCSGE